MSDVFSAQKRSEVMSRIRAKDTTPELFVRKMLHRRGLRYRLYNRKLAGTPDLTFARFRAVVFVHGCFWHAHRGCAKAHVPASRHDWWVAKLERNQERDRRILTQLTAAGWRVAVVWQCACAKRFAAVLEDRLVAFIRGNERYLELGRNEVQALAAAAGAHDAAAPEGQSDSGPAAGGR